MSELFLHYVWQFQYFNKAGLVTTTGEPVHIFSPGHRNSDGGPDFHNAKIRLADMQWVGSVEIHIGSSGWRQHHHDVDAAYDNVILHVVWKDDAPVISRDGVLIPTIELEGRVDERLIETYKGLLNNALEIPCSPRLPAIKRVTLYSTLDRVLTIRLENKSRDVRDLLHSNRGNWEETCYQLLARNFGFKVNADPFLTLARMLPYTLVMKHNDKLLQMEALFFGVAGFLTGETENEYQEVLHREYNLLRKKYRLDHVEMNKAQWKFLRLRPANFPTLRIAQFVSILHYRKNLFSGILHEDVEDLVKFFDTPPSSFWQTHYNFSHASKHKDAQLGVSSIHNVIINTVVPLYACYSAVKDDEAYMDKALRILYALPTESNVITRRWAEFSIKSRNAFDSQALLELYNSFCSRHRCLDCNIGASLVKPDC